MQASHCSGFSCCGAQALGAWASVVAACRLSSCSAWALGPAGFSSCGTWALECRLSSCGARAQLFRGTWDLPGPGIEPVSSALAGGFLTTAPPGKSLYQLYFNFKKFSFGKQKVKQNKNTGPKFRWTSYLASLNFWLSNRFQIHYLIPKRNHEVYRKLLLC